MEQRAKTIANSSVGQQATRLPDLAMAPGVFGRYVAPEWGCLAVGGASLCVSAFSNAFAPKAMGRVVDAYAKGQRRGAGLRVELRRTAKRSGVCADVFDAALRRKAAFFVLGEQSGDDRLDADAVATAVERDASVALAVCTEQLQNAFRYASSLFNGGSQLFALCPGLAGELLTCVPVLAVLVRGASSVAPAVVRVARRRRGHVRREPVVDANVEAAEAAVAGGFIRELDGAFLAEIGATGDRLSGGQRSRLSVALRGARDVLAPRRAHGRARRQDRGRSPRQRPGLAKARGVTVLLVAHSKAAVAKCDFASVLAGGAVVETGTVAVLAQDPKSKLAAALAAESRPGQAGDDAPQGRAEEPRPGGSRRGGARGRGDTRGSFAPPVEERRKRGVPASTGPQLSARVVGNAAQDAWDRGSTSVGPMSHRIASSGSMNVRPRAALSLCQICAADPGIESRNWTCVSFTRRVSQ
ncbi:ATPase [Aureococcus anophagefferens]|nr:ATPase [Aureococcus anophagefferens]